MGAVTDFFDLDALPVRQADPSWDEDAFHELAAARPSAASRPDTSFPEVLTPEEVELTRVPSASTLPLGYYQVGDVHVGGEGYVLRQGKVVRSITVLPTYWQEMIVANPDLVPPMSARRQREITRPVLLPISRDYNNYGHWWLDIAPRLHALQRQRPEMLRGSALAIPTDLAPWGREILGELFGIRPEDFEVYDSEREALFCRHAILPTMTHTNYNFHPWAADFYRRVVESCSGISVPRVDNGLIYLTRRRYVHQSRWEVRQLANAPEAEALAVAMGFTRVSPEELSWREQVALFSRSRVVAGEHGSAMKNLLFAPAGAVAVVINHLNGSQAIIAAMKDQHCLIIKAAGFDPSRHSNPYTVDLDRLSACLRHAVRLAGA